jgi:uncharacterized membrane protein
MTIGNIYLRQFGILMVIWYILWPIGMYVHFYPFWYTYCVKKNLATLICTYIVYYLLSTLAMLYKRSVFEEN